MKKATPLTFTIEKTAFPAQGIGTVEGRQYIAEGFFPGEKVQGIFQKYKQNQGHLKRIELLESAPGHVTPQCKHFRRCGGCLSQQLDLDLQRHYKKTEVLDLLQKAGIALDMEIPIFGVEQKYHYRNKMEFNFGDACKDGPMTLGMHEKNHGHNIVDTEDCQLISEDMNRIRSFTIEYFRQKNIPFYHWMSRSGYLRHLIIRQSASSAQLMVVLVTSTQLALDLTDWVNGLKALSFDGTLHSVIHLENDSVSNAVYQDRARLLFGAWTITEQLFRLDFHISALSFFQTNTKGAELLYDRVRQKIGAKKKLILDLYCGTGTIAQIVAEYAEQVIGIELIDQAVQAARASARSNALEHVLFYTGDVKDVLAELSLQPELIVVDPPRSGLHPKVITQLMEIAPEEIIYVSCNPKSLVKDLDALQPAYTIHRLELVDMFPNTPHCEVVVKLAKR